MQSEGFLGRLLWLLLKTCLSLTKNILKPLAKSVLIPSRLTAVAPAAVAEILRSGLTILINSNKESDHFMEIVKSLK